MTDYIIDWIGFPVVIEDPVFRTVFGESVLDADPAMVEKKVCEALIFKPSKLTGNEIRFLRHHMLMTQREFADALSQANHSVVSQWEAKGDGPACVNVGTEILLRLLVVQKALDSVTLEQALKRLQGIKLTDGSETIRIALSESRPRIYFKTQRTRLKAPSHKNPIPGWVCQERGDLGLAGITLTCQQDNPTNRFWETGKPGDKYVFDDA